MDKNKRYSLDKAPDYANGRLRQQSWGVNYELLFINYELPHLRDQFKLRSSWPIVNK